MKGTIGMPLMLSSLAQLAAYFTLEDSKAYSECSSPALNEAYT